MEVQVLDSIREGDATCLLCRTTLHEYVTSLPNTFREFYIQRGIVTNRFLDNLWDTLAYKRHIPPLVLVANSDISTAETGSTLKVDAEFKVLDGLQRSHRLKEIWDTIVFIDHEFDDQVAMTVPQLTRKIASLIRERGLNPQIFQKVLEAKRAGVDGLSIFQDNIIWLEIWCGLSEAQQIRKMLILNAGHKSVNIKHQVELLFWSNFEVLARELSPSKVYREKDKASITYSKGRQPGEFHFSHLVAAFVSLTAGSAVTTNADFSASQSFSGESEADEPLLDIDEALLSSFANTLKALDKGLSSELGIRWLGREVVLVGIFAAIGSTAQKMPGNKIETLEKFNAAIPRFVEYLNLTGFEAWRNNLELSKVNIGSVNRRAVFNATSAFLQESITGPIDWSRMSVKDARHDAA